MRGIGATVAALVVLALAGVPNLATGGPLDWNLDLETGAEWRTMTSEELEAVGWAGHTGWMTKDHGGLDDFADGTTAEVHVAYNETGHNLGGDHCDAVDAGGGEYTVMVNPDECDDYTRDDVRGWVNWFSDTNRDTINECVNVDPGEDPCYR